MEECPVLLDACLGADTAESFAWFPSQPSFSSLSPASGWVPSTSNQRRRRPAGRTRTRRRYL